MQLIFMSVESNEKYRCLKTPSERDDFCSVRTNQTSAKVLHLNQRQGIKAETALRWLLGRPASTIKLKAVARKMGRSLHSQARSREAILA